MVVAGVAILASPTLSYSKALAGLDLVEDLTGDTIESMKADMVRRACDWCVMDILSKFESVRFHAVFENFCVVSGCVYWLVIKNDLFYYCTAAALYRVQ